MNKARQRDCCHKTLFYFARHQYSSNQLLLNTKYEFVNCHSNDNTSSNLKKDRL